MHRYTDELINITAMFALEVKLSLCIILDDHVKKLRVFVIEPVAHCIDVIAAVD